MTNEKGKFNKEDIISLLKDYNGSNVEKFAAYCVRLLLEKKKNSQEKKNPYMQYKTAEDLAILFKRVDNEGLIFDGNHITLQSTGVSYDYVAYKSKMLLAYPETKFDIQLVYKGDTYDFKKFNGEIIYNHEIENPFDKKDSDIIGAYCVIKNNRGEFLTTLSKEEIEKHRNVARTDYIWKAWFSEMCLKTITKKGCKLHFGDVFKVIEEMDNENYDLDKVKILSDEEKEQKGKDLKEKYKNLAPNIKKDENI